MSNKNQLFPRFHRAEASLASLAEKAAEQIHQRPATYSRRKGGCERREPKPGKKSARLLSKKWTSKHRSNELVFLILQESGGRSGSLGKYGGG